MRHFPALASRPLPEAAILATRNPGEGPGRSRSRTKDPGPRPGQGGSRGHPGAQERALNLLFHAYMRRGHDILLHIMGKEARERNAQKEKETDQR